LHGSGALQERAELTIQAAERRELQAMDLVRALQAGRERMEQLASAEGASRGWGGGARRRCHAAV